MGVRRCFRYRLLKPPRSEARGFGGDHLPRWGLGQRPNVPLIPMAHRFVFLCVQSGRIPPSGQNPSYDTPSRRQMQSQNSSTKNCLSFFRFPGKNFRFCGDWRVFHPILLPFAGPRAACAAGQNGSPSSSKIGKSRPQRALPRGMSAAKPGENPRAARRTRDALRAYSAIRQAQEWRRFGGNRRRKAH